MKDKIEKANGCEMTQKYIAKELTHFTKKCETLCAILEDRVLLGGPDIEFSRKGGIEFISMYREDISRNSMIEVNKVCFSDIPEGQNTKTSCPRIRRCSDTSLIDVTTPSVLGK